MLCSIAEKKQELGHSLSEGHSISSEMVVFVKQISKKYNLYDHPLDQLKDLLLKRFGKKYGKEFWALKDISFDICKGEIFGIIGRNGAGKSTLLQILAGILQPNSGLYTIKGRVASLLELGSGFNPDFTGRENVFLSGAVLGFSRDEMRKKFDEIVSFADIGDFIDQPVKVYSSGMMARLAYATQSFVEPDILIIDEALGVGDIFFQQKCAAHMQEISDKGTTLIIVSHDMHVIRTLCSRTLLLDRGKALFYGDSSEAIRRYYTLQTDIERMCTIDSSQKSQPTIYPQSTDFNDFLSECQWVNSSNSEENEPVSAEILGVSFQNIHGESTLDFQMCDHLIVKVLCESNLDEYLPYISIDMRNRFSHLIFCGGTYTKNLIPPVLKKNERIICTIDIELGLEAGQYTLLVSTGLADTGGEINKGIRLFSTPSLGPITINWDYTKNRAPFFGSFNVPCKVEYLID